MTLPPRPPFTGRWGAASDTGAVRRHNEDSFLAAPPLFLVADGMGGHAAGDIASATVIASFARFVDRPAVSEDDLRDTVRLAQQSVAEFFALSVRSGGSTLSGIGVSSVGGVPAAVVVNVGDSRTYRLREGMLDQLSKDHSVVQDLIDSGAIDAVEARTHPQRNIITRAISSAGPQEPDVWSVPVQVGDRFLVCTDGLTGELTDAEIRAVLTAHDEPQSAASELVSQALAAGGRDNITVVVVVIEHITAVDVPTPPWQHHVPGEEDSSGTDVEVDDTIPTRRE